MQMTPELMSAAADMMKGMTADDMQRMASMAAGMGGSMGGGECCCHRL